VDRRPDGREENADQGIPSSGRVAGRLADQEATDGAGPTSKHQKALASLSQSVLVAGEASVPLSPSVVLADEAHSQPQAWIHPRESKAPIP
jgi:hypothetical protein